MDNLELPKNTPICLLEDIPSLAISYMRIPVGTKGYIVDYERHPIDNEIIGYYANIYGIYFEEYIYLDRWEFK